MCLCVFVSQFCGMWTMHTLRAGALASSSPLPPLFAVKRLGFGHIAWDTQAAPISCNIELCAHFMHRASLMPRALWALHAWARLIHRKVAFLMYKSVFDAYCVAHSVCMFDAESVRSLMHGAVRASTQLQSITAPPLLPLEHRARSAGEQPNLQLVPHSSSDPLKCNPLQHLYCPTQQQRVPNSHNPTQHWCDPFLPLRPRTYPRLAAL